tara:strand:+ start:489 stop:1676 length:1188 start_codon:yes stop_codon:yes gene_type:complete
MAIAYPSLVSVLTTDTFEEWRKKTNAMIEHTQANQGNLGDLGFLSTDDKSTAVQALNEVDTHADTNTANIGTMSDLNSSIVKADLVQTINAEHLFQNTQTVALILEETQRSMSAEGIIQSELDLTQQSLGILNNGTYNAITESSYTTVSSATTLQGAVSALDATVKVNNDLLDTLGATVGGGVDGQFNWSGSTVTYLTTNNLGNAVVKDNLLALDSQVKSNTDANQSNTTAIGVSNGKQLAIIAALGTPNADGIMFNDPRNKFANVDNITDNIKLLDDKIQELDDTISGSLAAQLTTLQNQIDLRVTTEDFGTAISGTWVGGQEDLTTAVQNLYALLKPFLDGAATPYVRKAGDTMSGTLQISGGNLVVNGTADGTPSTSRRITCTGDIVGYDGS